MKNINLLLIVFFLMMSCSSMSDAKKILKNQKVRTTDEFLVKKRNPLEIPPNFEEVLKPGKKFEKKNDDEKIKKILNVPKTVNTIKNKSKSTEESILKRIRK